MKKQLVIFILLGIIAIPSSVKAQKLKVSLSAGLSKSILIAMFLIWSIHVMIPKQVLQQG